MRIVAGSAKGRPIQGPKPTSKHIRPTADRVRETLFNVLPPEQNRDRDIANTVRALADDLLMSFDDIDIDEAYNWLILQAAQIEERP